MIDIREVTHNHHELVVFLDSSQPDPGEREEFRLRGDGN